MSAHMATQKISFNRQYINGVDTRDMVWSTSVSRIGIVAQDDFVEIDQPEIDLDSMVDKLWEKMMNKKPIVFCAHCEAAMVFDSPTCPQCGAPGGRAIR